jgi:phosphoglycolate phosphatase
MTRYLVLDLDGTLVDSVPDLAASLNRLLATRDLAPLSRDAVQAMVGDGARALVQRGFAAHGRSYDDADLADFLTDYGANAAVLSAPYPDVTATLQHLRETGWTMAVCTNKPIAPARQLLSALGLSGFFASVGGGDSYKVRKPDPGHLLATLQEAGGVPARAVMVGDHHNDVHAAHGAGVASIWAAWGYGVNVTGADADAARFADLPGLLERLVPKIAH